MAEWNRAKEAVLERWREVRRLVDEQDRSAVVPLVNQQDEFCDSAVEDRLAEGGSESADERFCHFCLGYQRGGGCLGFVDRINRLINVDAWDEAADEVDAYIRWVEGLDVRDEPRNLDVGAGVIDRHDYPVRLRWKTDKRGDASAPGLPSLEVATPPEFGGHEGIWSPEHLFVAAVASCLLTTFLAIAEASKLEFRALTVDAEGHLERGDDRRYRIVSITLRPRLTLSREKDADRGARILEKAESNCLISNSIRSEIRLEPHVEWE